MIHCSTVACQIGVVIALLFNTCSAQPVPLPKTEVSGKLIHDPELLSYRDARRSINTYERYAKPKDLIRFQYQLTPKQVEGFSYDDLTLAIEDEENLVVLKTVRGFADVPLHPPVNERKARFAINRPKGSLELGYTVSTTLRDDQHYDQPYLRRGCEQAHDLIRTQDPLNALLEAGKKCVGVRILLLSEDSIVVRRDVDGRESEIPITQGRFNRQAVARWSDQLSSIEVRPLKSPHVLAAVTE